MVLAPQGLAVAALVDVFPGVSELLKNLCENHQTYCRLRIAELKSEPLNDNGDCGACTPVICKRTHDSRSRLHPHSSTNTRGGIIALFTPIQLQTAMNVSVRGPRTARVVPHGCAVLEA
jgi:hypothetical protein